MILTRRAVVAGGAGALGGLAITAPVWGAGAEALANSAQGKLRGTIEKGICAFRGIPYGGSVSAPDARFRAPPPPPSWTGVRDATVFGAPAMQAGGAMGSEPAPAEDCLFLNVWTPAADHKRRPVMFYSHGGGFTIGSGARQFQNGANLARDYDVVVVESNHRLGIFGYLYLGGLLGPEYPANPGLLDLVAALRWVNVNIAAFGGDPHNVMIFGESGGGGKTTCLYGMPSAAPFFNKASIESPIGPGNGTPEQATEFARQVVKAFGLTDPRKLLEIPADRLLAYQLGDDPSAPGTVNRGQRNNRDQLFWPIIDGTVLPELPFKTRAPAISARKPLIVGGCKDEAVFFNMGDPTAFKLDEAGLRERVGHLFSDRADAWITAFRKTRPNASPSQLLMAIETASPWRAHAVHIAEGKAAQAAAPVYSYILSYQSPNKVPNTDYPIGAPHASDIAIKFDNAVLPPGAPAFGPFSDQTPGRLQTAKNMSALWTSFARTGRPSAPGQPEWRPYTLDRRETMLIDAQCRLVSDPEGEERRFWESQPESRGGSRLTDTH